MDDGGNFSRTSENIVFNDGKLYASCRTTAYEWVPAILDLNFYVENIDGTLQFATQPPGNFLLTSENVTLTGTILRGTAKRRDSSQKTFKLDLDRNVANIEGRLVWLVNPQEPFDSIDNGKGGFGSYDASGDPALIDYVKSIQPHRVKREVNITPPESVTVRHQIASIVARWDLDSMDRGWRQRTLVEFPRELPSWRIDNQENGSFDVQGLQYYSVAVQRGSAVYANVLVPVGYNVGRTRIRNAFLRSRDEGRVVRIAPPAPQERRQPPPQNDPRIAQKWVMSLQWIVVVGLAVICL